ncbi:MAG: hypothetical protein GF381_02265 [Candidatus Pacebacteria bacterium]|nr:hypothetical protein [Candidatus Paceibacterota bacterium]
MATNQYHEPVDQLDDQAQDYARMMQTMIEEAEAIDWYEQRIQATKDEQLRTTLRHAQEEEYEHFALALEWLIRRSPAWKKMLKKILFTKGDLVQVVEQAEKDEKAK